MKILKLHPKNPVKTKRSSRSVGKAFVSRAEAAANGQSGSNTQPIFRISAALAMQGNSVFEFIRMRMEETKQKSGAFFPADLDFLGPGDYAANFLTERGEKKYKS
ncbi:hypothetical protein JOC77_001464 [Peribacillus deserti]|uniref:Uncharacterized protein n=1 Tax=Peribacillus deserti TaxID=673318 RepID=A0ABS2QG13_9BACI|nr:hypothetical protein [Peribacillus deserti]MBM7692037.1 hypothetical protein [Peribacillus deserti]